MVVEEGMERGMTSPESSFTKMLRLSTASVVERIESAFERNEASDEDLEERMMVAWM